jgi:hypothetical protein
MPSEVQQISQKQSNLSHRAAWWFWPRCLSWNRRSYVRAASHHRHTRILCYDEMRCVCVREVIFPESARRLTRPFWARVLILFLTSRWHRGCARPLTDRYNIRDTHKTRWLPAGRGRCERGKRRAHIEGIVCAPCDGIAIIAAACTQITMCEKWASRLALSVIPRWTLRRFASVAAIALPRYGCCVKQWKIEQFGGWAHGYNEHLITLHTGDDGSQSHENTLFRLFPSRQKHFSRTFFFIVPWRSEMVKFCSVRLLACATPLKSHVFLFNICVWVHLVLALFSRFCCKLSNLRCSTCKWSHYLERSSNRYTYMSKMLEKTLQHFFYRDIFKAARIKN